MLFLQVGTANPSENARFFKCIFCRKWMDVPYYLLYTVQLYVLANFIEQINYFSMLTDTEPSIPLNVGLGLEPCSLMLLKTIMNFMTASILKLCCICWFTRWVINSTNLASLQEKLNLYVACFPNLFFNLPTFVTI